jgi:putative DNA primase/helicase
MSAVVSNGGTWPCGEGSTIAGDVIFMSAEDGIRDTIIPRLMAAGADTTRVHIVVSATKPDGTGRKTFSLKTDVDLLEAKAKEIGYIRLIIVDPISAYMGGSDGNGNVETREVLEPLAEMADRLRIAVVAVTHLNKGGAGGQSALNRFAGSIAFVAAARAAFAVIEDSEDDERRLLLQAKNNLGAKCKGLASRDGFGAGAKYVLSLPGTSCAPKNSMCALSETRAHIANPGAHDGAGEQNDGPPAARSGYSPRGLLRQWRK